MERRVFLKASGGALLLSSVLKPFSLASSAIANPQEWFRAGIDLTVSQGQIRQDGVTTIWADIIRLEGMLTSHGHSVRLVAREIHFLPNSGIDTRGVEAVPSFPAGDAAKPGTDAGENGADGMNGGTGTNAGDVLLVASQITGVIQINAGGRSGGNAQDGGAGAKGARGKKGKTCQPGARGGTGGAGGKAGRPGDGGNGGMAMLYASVMSSISEANVTVAKGLAGQTANHGQPGEGGPGGEGGNEDREFNEPRR